MNRPFYLLTVLLLIVTLGLVACGGSSPQRIEDSAVQAAAAPAGDAINGQKLFEGTCSACHGPKGEGIPGLGKDMTHSEFIAAKSDQELIDFIKVGRDPGDPLNSTGVGMPAKGGNPALSESDLGDIVAFIRTMRP